MADPRVKMITIVVVDMQDGMAPHVHVSDLTDGHLDAIGILQACERMLAEEWKAQSAVQTAPATPSPA
jgi:hypothetical protein